MTKPVWEQDWSAVDQQSVGIACELHWGEGQHHCLPWAGTADVEEDLAACRLASAAPDAIRVLLHLYENEPECVVCHEQVWWNDATDKMERPHKPDCALDAALRKAGVR